jgi:hypothetical protein
VNCIMCGGGGADKPCTWTGDPLCRRCAPRHDLGACLAVRLTGPARDQAWRAVADPLAAGALQAAIEEDHDAAIAAVNEIGGALGPGAVIYAMYRWADTLIYHMPGGGPDEGGHVSLAWLPEPGATPLAAGDVDPLNRWAGQFIAARTALDHGACKALIAAAEGEETLHVWALLCVVAVNLRALTTPAPEGDPHE